MQIRRKILLKTIAAVFVLTVLLVISMRFFGQSYTEVKALNKLNYITAGRLPRYSSSEVKKVSSEVKSKQQNGSFTFEFITDSHYDSSSLSRKTALRHFQEVKDVAKAVKADLIVHGGDIVDGYSKKQKSIIDLNTAANYLLKGEKIPTFLLKGNHDDNSYYNVRNTPKSSENVISQDEMYDATVKKYENSVLRDDNNPDGMYYYKDFPDKKIRIIVLNTNDLPEVNKSDGSPLYNGIIEYGISNEQLNWVAHTALNFSNIKDRQQWGVIIFSHVCFLRSINFNKAIHNGEIMVNIIESFKNGQKYDSKKSIGDFAQEVKTDFSSQGPMQVIAMISGHVHQDIVRSFDGINYITTLNSAPIALKGRGAPERTLNTASENAFDTFVVDKKNRKLYIYRYGAGENRVVQF